MSERFSRAEKLEYQVQMLLGIFSANGVLPLEPKPANSIRDLLTQHLAQVAPFGPKDVLPDRPVEVARVDTLGQKSELGVYDLEAGDTSGEPWIRLTKRLRAGAT
jgi:hypothetical protein